MEDEMIVAPVVLFVYARLALTKLTIEALQKNYLAQVTDLIIFSDGPKKSDHALFVNDVRDYLKTINGFKTVTIIERQNNMGLAASIIAGVTQVINQYDRVIVLEDDLQTSPYFLTYMNDGLNTYATNDRVGSINGYLYPITGKTPNTFFLRYADCWGWATWKRAWNLFESNGGLLLEQIKNKSLQNVFDFDNTYQFTQMLEQQALGHIGSWAIRWQASLFLSDKLSLYPGKSLVNNIGLTAELGEHSNQQGSQACAVTLGVGPVALDVIPVLEHSAMRTKIKKFFKKAYGLPLSDRIKSYVSNKIKKIFNNVICFLRCLRGGWDPALFKANKKRSESQIGVRQDVRKR